MNSEVFFENKKYISAKQAGKVTGYSQDYVGQLCRTGKLDAKRIGRVWYIFEDSILNHKNSPAKIEETSRQVLPKVLDNSFPNSGVTPNDLRESRVGEILDVIKITGQRSQTLIKPLIFSKSVLAFAFGFLLTVGAVSYKGDKILTLQKLSQNISSAPTDAYNAMSEVEGFYSQKLGEGYVGFGQKFIRLSNSAIEQSALAVKNPPLFIISSLEKFSLKEKTFLEENFSFAKKIISNGKAQTFVFISDALNLSSYSNKNKSGSVNLTADAYLSNSNLNYLDKTGVVVFDIINGFLNRAIYSPLAAFFSSPKVVEPPTVTFATTAPKEIKKQTEKIPLVPPKTIIERVTERIITKAPEGLLTQASLDEQLQALSNKILSQMYVQFAGLSTGTGGSITNVYQQIAQSQKIDNLSNTSISSPSISGGSISGTAISATSLSASTFSSSGLSTFAAKVGIGSTTPGYPLSVSGSAYFDGGTVTAANVIATSTLSVPSFTLSGTAVDSLLSTNSSGNVVATSAPTFGNFNATSTVATSTISTGGLAVGTNQFIVQQNSGNVGIGTTSPNNKLDVNGNAYFSGTSFFGGAITATSTANITGLLSFVNASGTQLTTTGSAYLATTGGNVGIGTTTPFGSFAINSIADQPAFTVGSSTGTSLMIDKNGNVGIGTSSPYRALSVVGSGIFTGNFLLEGTTGATFSGAGAGLTFTGTGNHDITASAGTLRIGSNTVIGNIQALDDTVDIGTAGVRFDKIYANEVNATTLIGTISGGNVNAETLTLNFDNATADGEDSIIAFERGSVTPNALLTWNSSLDRLDFNMPIFIQNAGSTTTVPTLSLKGATSQTADIFSVSTTTGTLIFNVTSSSTVGIASSTPFGTLSVNTTAGEPGFVVGSSTGTHFIINKNGNVGIASTTPGYALSVAGNGYFDGGTVFASLFTSTSTTGVSTFPYASTTNITSTGYSAFATSGGLVGVGTTSPWGLLSLNPNALGTNLPSFVIGSSTTTHLIVTGKGYLGLGSTTPGYRFSVDGDGYFGSQLTSSYFSATSTTATSTISTGGFAVGTNQFVVQQNSGNVGIGTTSPQSKLEAVNTSSGATADQLYLSNLASATSTASRLTFRANDITNGTSTSAITSILTQNWNTGKGDLAFSTLRSGLLTEAMRITDTGNVGIASTTPGYALSVAGNGYFDGGTVFASLFTSTSTTGASTFPYASTTNITSTGYSSFATSGGLVGVGTSSPWGLLAVNPNALGTNLPSFVIGSSTDTKFIVTNTGNVGIGDTFPVGNLSIGSATGAEKWIETGSHSDTVSSWIGMDVDTSHTNGFSGIEFGGVASANEGYVAIHTHDLGISDGERMRIDKSGNVGIATTTPWGLLAVNPNALGTNVPSFVVGSSTGTKFIVANSGNVGVSTASSSPVGTLTVVGPTISDTGRTGTFATGRGVYIAPPQTLTSASIIAVDYRALEVAPYLFTLASSTLATNTYGSLYNAYTLSSTSAVTTTNASTLAIYGAPIASSSNITISSSTALSILTSAVNTASGAVTNAYGLFAQAPTGATNNYAAAFTGGSVGIGTSSPWGLLSLNPNALGTNLPSFVIGSSTDTKFIVANTGNVGIGDTTPDYLLDVAGIINADTALLVGATPASAGSLIRATNNTYINFRNAAGSADLGFGGIDSSNNLLIGTSPGGSYVGNVNINPDSADMDFIIESDTNASHFVSDAGQFAGGGAFGIGNAGGNAQYINIAPPAITTLSSSYAVLSIGASSGTTLGQNATIVASAIIGEPEITLNGFTVDDAYSLRISGAPTEGTRNGALWVASGVSRFDGNVGIGTSTPLSLLDIFKANGDASLALTASSTLGVQYPWTIGTDLSDGGKFKIASSTVLGTNDRFTIDGNGNVGIGETAPGSKLHVNHPFDGDVTVASFINTDLTGDSSRIEIGSRVSGTQNSLIVGHHSVGSGDAGNYGYLHMFGDSKGDGLVIADTGKVGIGTTSPQSKLEAVNTSSGATADQLYLSNLASATSTASRLTFRANDITNGTSTSAITSILTQNWNTGKGDLAFSTLRSGLLTEAMRITDTGNVGIGTTSPNAILSVVATETAVGNASTTAFILDTTAKLEANGGPLMEFRHGGQSVAFIHGSSGSANTNPYLTFGTGLNSAYPLERMRIDENGNVGIGTTGPDGLLVVQSASAGIGPHANADELVVEGSGHTGLSILAGASSNASIMFGDSGSATIGQIVYGHSDNHLEFHTNGSEALRITSDGNLGIGMTGPNQPLVVSGAMGHRIIATHAGTSVGDTVGIEFNFNAGTGNNDGNLARILASTVSGGGGDMFFQTAPSTTGTYATKMTLTRGGNFGVGTTTPFAKLSVHAFNGETNTTLFAVASSTANATTTLFSISNAGVTTIGDSSGTGDANFQFASDTNAWSMGYYSVDKTFRIASSTNLTANVHFQIGKSGTTTLSSGLGTGTGGNYLCIDTTTFEVLRGNGAACTASALRFKENVEDLSYGLTEVLALRPVSYNYKVGTNMGNGVKLGFIADEMQTILPEVVTLDEHGEVFGLDYPVLTSVLAKAIQEMNGILNISAVVGTTTPILTVDTNGNVGIGTTTPSSKFHVFSNISGGGVATFTDQNASCTIDPTNASLVCSSDQNLKKDIVALNATSTLDKLMSLRAVDYHWSGESSAVGTHTGFVAQEVEQIFPEFVSTDKNGRKAVAYSNLIPVMVTAIQQLNNKVNAVDSRLTNLEALVASNASATVSSSSGLSFGEILSLFENLGVKVTDGIAYFKGVVADKLTIGSSVKPTGVTLYDEVTGSPYCLKIQNGAVASLAGECTDPVSGTSSSGTATTTPSGATPESSPADTSFPVISVLGDNPAQITVGSSYSDLGATVTDTNADGTLNNNLGLRFSVNGASVNDISLDTSTSTTHTIVYSAVDGADNWGYATRTVEVLPIQ